MPPVLRPAALRAPLLACALALGAPACWSQAVAPEIAPGTAPSAAPSVTVAPTATVADADPARVGTFKLVKGETWIGTGAQRRAPQPGDSLREADSVSTGKNGAASLVLRDGTVITVGPQSRVDLTRFQFDTTTQQGNFLLDLLQGSVRVVTGLLAKVNPELFKVKTPTSVVGVRGTDFIVETQAAQ